MHDGQYGDPYSEPGDVYLPGVGALPGYAPARRRRRGRADERRVIVVVQNPEDDAHRKPF